MTDINFTPVELEVLLHVYYLPEQHPRANTPAVGKAYAALIMQGLIKANPTEGCYECTSLGRAHVEQLCRLPLPKERWIDYKGDVIDD